MFQKTAKIIIQDLHLRNVTEIYLEMLNYSLNFVQLIIICKTRKLMWEKIFAFGPRKDRLLFFLHVVKGGGEVWRITSGEILINLT